MFPSVERFGLMLFCCLEIVICEHEKKDHNKYKMCARIFTNEKSQFYTGMLRMSKINENLARIAKSCPENMSSVVEMLSCFY